MANIAGRWLWQKRPGGPFYVRRSVPARLQPIIGKKIVAKSTGEVDPKRAEAVSWRLKIEIDDLFKEAERKLASGYLNATDRAHGLNTPEQREAFARAYAETAGVEVMEAVAYHYLYERPELESEDGIVTEELQDKLIEEYRRELKTIRRAIGRDDMTMFEAEARDGSWTDLAESVSETWVKQGDIPEELVERIAPIIAKGHVAALEKAIAGLGGDPDPEIKDPELIFQTTPRLSESIKPWMEARASAQRAAGKVARASTESDNEMAVRVLIELLGDKRLDAITQRDMAEHKLRLEKLPREHGRDPKFRAMGYRRMLDVTERDPSIPTLSATTVNKHFGALRMLFDWAAENEIIQVNPCARIKTPKSPGKKGKRLAWSSDQLATFFGSPMYRGCMSDTYRARPGQKIIADHKFWLPILAVFTGARLEELAQLRRSDIIKIEGIPAIRIHDDNGGHVKTEAARRMVPLHEAILATGFLQYADDVVREPDGFVFPRMKPNGPDARRGYDFGKWFPRFRDQLGIAGVQFHGFRHNATTALVEADVPEEIRMQLIGHERSRSAQDIYNKGVSLPKLREAVNRIAYPGLDVSHVRYERGRCVLLR